MKAAPKDCPCHSKRAYKACCKALHDGEPASSPEALMRSRYAAFALGLGAYLYDTLSQAHDDRSHGRDEVVRELSRMKETRRFLDLCIVHAKENADEGEVLFGARIFERGKDVSFAERSRFRREDGAWRYHSGDVVTRKDLAGEALTLESFEHALNRSSPSS